MSRIIELKSTTGNGKKYIIKRSISQPKKFWNLIVFKNGIEKYQESGYRTIKEAREGITKYQVSWSIY